MGAPYAAAKQSIAKLDLVTLAETILDDRRLRINPDLPFADIVRREIEFYEMKENKKGDAIYDAGRQSKWDDLVFAVLLALYHSHHSVRECRIIPQVGAEPIEPGGPEEWAAPTEFDARPGRLQRPLPGP